MSLPHTYYRQVPEWEDKTLRSDREHPPVATRPRSKALADLYTRGQGTGILAKDLLDEVAQ